MSQGDYDIPEVFRRAMEDAGWRPEDAEGGGGDGPRRPLPPPDNAPRFNRWLLIAVAVILFLFSLGSLASFYTDWLWFDHLGYRDIFTTQLVTRLVVFAIAFAVAALIMASNWWFARRNALRATSPLNNLNFLKSRTAGWVVWLAAVGLALLFAGAAAGQWDHLLSYINRVPFNIADPIFGHDVGFYIFELPVFEFIQGWLLSVLFVTLLGLVPIYAINNLGDIQRGNWRPFNTQSFRAHLLALGAAFLVVWALGSWLEIYRLLFSSRGVAFGASYTDLTASLWALRIQLGLTLLLAALLIWNIFRTNTRVLVLAAGTIIVVSIVAGSLVPSFLQRYVVEPNELTLEEPYILHNIEFTRAAFKLDRVESQPFGQVENLSPQDLLDNEETLRNIRLWDYRPLQQTYQQLQALRPYYEFNEIDIDRYEIDGQSRQVMLAARELAKDRLPAPSWVNRKLEFTHGYGIVMNPVNEISREGQPQFFIQDLPPRSTVPLEVTQPEIYFGELTNDAVYVSSGREEFNYPSGDENVYTNYDGTGGILLDSFLKRAAFAIQQSDANVLLSNDITSGTRVQYKRQIQERIRTLTPFLELDRDPYIVLSEGKLIWMQDAYTISNDYPYSTPISVQVPTNSVANTPAAAALPPLSRTVNYMRNSVKVTVDAYNGDVNYYVADAEDPLVQTYAKTYPGVFKPLSEMPEGLISHLRYPIDFFSVQARQYLTYHMTDVRVFYNKEDLWQIPTEIYDNNQQTIEPYYVSLPLPGRQEPEYLLILPISPASKNNMVAWMAARNDVPNYGELRVYELSRQELIFGPMQVEGRIDQDPEISQQFSLWDQRGSRVIRGNLLVLPVNDSFLYVEPIYLLSETNALPELRRIVTASNRGVAMEPTLESSLIALSSSSFVDVPVVDGDLPETEPPIDGSVPLPTPPPLAADATVQSLVDQANGHLAAATVAQRAGDWALYGQELESLRITLDQLEGLISQE
jgi:uncharacterized membrane protein (UPF0182 family)